MFATVGRASSSSKSASALAACEAGCASWDGLAFAAMDIALKKNESQSNSAQDSCDPSINSIIEPFHITKTTRRPPNAVAGFGGETTAAPWARNASIRSFNWFTSKPT
jgi:hypothetical protein